MIQAIQTHGLSIMILIVLYVSIKQQSRAVQQKNRYFLTLVLINIIVMTLKIVMVLTKGYTSGIEEVLFHVSTALYYMSTLVLVLFWLLYLHDRVKGENTSKRNLLLYFLPLMGLGMLLVLLSALGLPVLYEIKPFGVFEKHVMYTPFVICQYSIMIGSSLYVVINSDKLSKFEAITLILYQIPPAVGIILNEIFLGFDLLWPSMTLSLLIVYTNIQSKMTNTDPLTGVFNRREYEKKVNYLSNIKTHVKKVCAMMIDIDDFKQINDLNSHQMGDMALIEVSQILQRSVRKNDFIARIGGDEFCVIIESDQESVLHEVINRINHQIDLYNSEREELPRIHISIGYGIYDAEYYASFKDFFNRLDKQMYHDKHTTKASK